MTKILLVEDDKSLREIYGVRLLAEGYDIVSAGDGEEALAMAIKERPTLIISDVMMPKISGFDMLDILRSTTETKEIKVIIMTALSSEDQRSRGEGLGADRFLVKSQVGIEDVVRTVHEVLGDAPVAASTPAQSFAPQQPAAPRPITPVPPRPEPPVVQPQVLQPVQQTPAPQTQPIQPAPQPWQPQQPASNSFSAQPQTAPAPQSSPSQDAASTSSMPQPTAPFSTSRPANLGDRIIHPLPQPERAAPDFNHLMAQELNNATPSAQPQVAPPVPPQPPRPFVPDLTFEETPLPPGSNPPQQSN